MKFLNITTCALLLTLAAMQANAQNALWFGQAKELSKKVDSLAQIGKWKEIEQKYFDTKRLAERSIEGLKLSEEEEEGFVDGVIEGIGSVGYFPAIGKQSTSFNLLRVREMNGTYSILFRAIMSNGGLNYYDFVVERNKKGEVKIVDGYIYAGTGYMSDIMRDMLLSAMPDGFGSVDKEGERTIKSLRSMTKAKNEGNFAKVLAEYNQLLPKDKKQKIFLSYRVTASQNVSVEEYKAALDDYYANFPNEQGISLLLIDRYFLDENYSKVIEAIHKTDSIVGGDSYLELLRGNVYISLEEYHKAEASLKRFIADFPKMAIAYPSYVSILIVNEKYGLAIETIKKWEKETGEKPLEVMDFTGYEEFNESEEFLAYKASRK